MLSFSKGERNRNCRRVSGAGIDALEARRLLSTVSVNATQTIRTVNNQILGVNVDWWDTALNTSQTESMVTAAGLTAFRLPGGSSSDTFHFNVGPTYGGEGTAATFAQFISAVNGIGMVTLDYGTGSPQEAAAWLSYLNASPSNTTVIGYGQEWNSSSNTWVQVNWQTAGYWAGVRAATPLTHDDGLNFLRIGRSAPFNTHYFEVGNEIYGSWETDEHGSGGDTGKPHDAATYVAFAKQFSLLANQISPGISIGVDGDGPDTWMANVLQQSATQGFTPGFISDHNYMYGPGQENDSTLLTNTISKTSSSLSWASRSNGYRSQLSQYLGTAGNNVELLGTEFNSVYSNPGKQTTSLVNGLFVADSLGAMLETTYDGSYFWDLRNGWDTGENNSSSLYGWRQGGDYGMIGSSGTAPSTGTYVPYPTYFAEELVSKMAHNGDTVVSASSSINTLAVYAVREQSGDMDLLVINKSSTTVQAPTISFTGFEPNGQATFWQYGKTQDTAQSQTSNGASSLGNFSQTLTVTGASVSISFPAYSMTVVDLGTAPAPQVLSATYSLANQSLAVQFNANVSASLSPADLQMVNNITEASVPTANIAEVFNTSNDTATFTFPGYAGGVLPSGVYSTVLIASGITDAAGDRMATDYAYRFAIVNSNTTLALGTFHQGYTVNQLLMGSGATLDIGNMGLAVQYTADDPETQIQSWISSGDNLGQWNGLGINSSVAAADAQHNTAVGLFDDGQQVKISLASYGDANKDGQLNADDVSLMLAGQAAKGTRWQDGNFNYDSQIDADDWMLFERGVAIANVANSSAAMALVSAGGQNLLAEENAKPQAAPTLALPRSTRVGDKSLFGARVSMTENATRPASGAAKQEESTRDLQNADLVQQILEDVNPGDLF